jgi:hypothetical protein
VDDVPIAGSSFGSIRLAKFEACGVSHDRHESMQILREIAAGNICNILIVLYCGEVAERLNAPVLKTGKA